MKYKINQRLIGKNLTHINTVEVVVISKEEYYKNYKFITYDDYVNNRDLDVDFEKDPVYLYNQQQDKYYCYNTDVVEKNFKPII